MPGTHVVLLWASLQLPLMFKIKQNEKSKHHKYSYVKIFCVYLLKSQQKMIALWLDDLPIFTLTKME